MESRVKELTIAIGTAIKQLHVVPTGFMFIIAQSWGDVSAHEFGAIIDALEMAGAITTGPGDVLTWVWDKHHQG